MRMQVAMHFLVNRSRYLPGVYPTLSYFRAQVPMINKNPKTTYPHMHGKQTSNIVPLMTRSPMVKSPDHFSSQMEGGGGKTLEAITPRSSTLGTPWGKCSNLQQFFCGPTLHIPLLGMYRSVVFDAVGRPRAVEEISVIRMSVVVPDRAPLSRQRACGRCEEE